MFACSILNLVLVPINFRLAKLEVEYILNDSKSKMIFYGEEFEKLIKNLNFKSLLKNKTVRITQDGNYSIFCRK
jgi:acyl-CoA synthetase (AMP-forming)/AMP-acid ligase II